MSYVLVNGTRYYKNDRTGELSVDNVSQEEADKRENQNRNSPIVQNRENYGNNRCRSTERNTIEQYTVNSKKRPFSWRMVSIAVVLIAVIGAFIYNHTHISLAEQTIIEYMKKDDTADSKYLDSSSRYLKVSEIAGYTKDEIQLMINEIYARHGRTFSSQKNIEYFSKMNWYQPVSGKSDEEIIKEFNEYERANIDLLSRYQ